MSTYVCICFEMRGGRECDRFFAYLQAHPRDVWDYEERVREELHADFRAHWTDADVLETAVRRLQFADVGVIEYRVALRRGARDPRLLVDMLRRCDSVQEGVAGGNWRVHAWYKKQGEMTWTEDAGNDGRLGRRCVRVQTLLGAMRLML